MKEHCRKQNLVHQNTEHLHHWCFVFYTSLRGLLIHEENQFKSTVSLLKIGCNPPVPEPLQQSPPGRAGRRGGPRAGRDAASDGDVGVQTLVLGVPLGGRVAELGAEVAEVGGQRLCRGPRLALGLGVAAPVADVAGRETSATVARTSIVLYSHSLPLGIFPLRPADLGGLLLQTESSSGHVSPVLP